MSANDIGALDVDDEATGNAGWGFLAVYDLAGDGEVAVGVVRHSEPNRGCFDECLRTGPVGHEPAGKAGGGQDVHEDIGMSQSLNGIAIMVDILIVLGSYR